MNSQGIGRLIQILVNRIMMLVDITGQDTGQSSIQVDTGIFFGQDIHTRSQPNYVTFLCSVNEHY